MRKFATLLFILSLFACQSCQLFRDSQSQNLRFVELSTKNGETIETTLVITDQDQEKGLSGTRSEDFSDNQGMLFFYLEESEKSFWMPDTYFDLDLFFLDKDLKVIDIIRKLPHYIGRANPELIPRARNIWSRHVLEMKSSSEIAQKIQMGDELKWKGKMSVEEIEIEARKLRGK